MQLGSLPNLILIPDKLVDLQGVRQRVHHGVPLPRVRSGLAENWTFVSTASWSISGSVGHLPSYKKFPPSVRLLSPIAHEPIAHEAFKVEIVVVDENS